jgi:repressor LexA
MTIPIGKRIKKVRDDLGLTQEQVAKKVGFSRQALSKIEKGTSESPDPSNLISLAKVLRNDFGLPELLKYIESDGALEIEIKSRVSAGRPLQFFENVEKIYIPARMQSRTGETFAVLVQGQSMINAGIFHGDIVILHECPEPFNGNTVLVRIGEGETSEYTLKTWHKDGSKITLKPENADFDAIIITKNSAEISVVGKFAGLIRFSE